MSKTAADQAIERERATANTIAQLFHFIYCLKIVSTGEWLYAHQLLVVKLNYKMQDIKKYYE